MEARARAIRDGVAGECVWLLSHPPLYTGGTSARPGDLLRRDFPIFDAGRGGQWTYHGPGQRVGYVMLDLTRPRGLLRARDVRSFVWCLEEWLIRATAAFGIAAARRAGRVGLWVRGQPGAPDAKIAAIGVRVTRWVSLHGVSLNIDPDLSHYAGIVPCGVADAGVTSFAALGVRPDASVIDAALRAAWETVFTDPAGGSGGDQAARAIAQDQSGSDSAMKAGGAT